MYSDLNDPVTIYYLLTTKFDFVCKNYRVHTHALCWVRPWEEVSLEGFIVDELDLVRRVGIWKP